MRLHVAWQLLQSQENLPFAVYVKAYGRPKILHLLLR